MMMMMVMMMMMTTMWMTTDDGDGRMMLMFGFGMEIAGGRCGSAWADHHDGCQAVDGAPRFVEWKSLPGKSQ